ncbi:MAG: tripartite tricarboxylate transporter substrate-binding protein [Hylemonella sp.]
MNHQSSQTIRRRRLLQQGAAAWLASCAAPAIWAQAYPSKVIRLVVPWPGGGLVDIAARQMANRLQAALGQPVIVENRVGAGGAIGAAAVATAAPDGHTLLLSTSALTMNTALGTKTQFDLLRDFEPVSLVAYAPSVLVVGPAINPGTVKELVDLARSQPGGLSYGSAGVGSPAHFAGELLKALEKIFVVHIPYTGAPAAMNDQLAGRVHFQFANAAVALPQIRAGKVKALAVTSAKRFSALPDVPTMMEAGVPTFEADQWLGILAPRGLAGPVMDRLVAECNKALGVEELRAALAKAGMTAAAPGTAASFDVSLRADLKKWTDLARAANIKSD